MRIYVESGGGFNMHVCKGVCGWWVNVHRVCVDGG